MKIGFIGAGKVGCTLGKYFKNYGAEIIGYYSKNLYSSKQAANFTKTKYFESLNTVVFESDILFLTVPDEQIKYVWNALKQLNISNKIICHCSGAMSSNVFDGLDDKQAFGYSVHPFFAVSSKFASYKEISNAFFTIEGSCKYIYYLKDFIERMGNVVNIISENQKVKYHGAAVFLSNHVSAVAYRGTEMLKECGFDEKTISIALKTLFLSHCENISKEGIINTLTGPIERNDKSTIKKHLDILCGDSKSLYVYLSKELIKIAKEKHVGRDYNPMESIINDEMEKA